MFSTKPASHYAGFDRCYELPARIGRDKGFFYVWNCLQLACCDTSSLIMNTSYPAFFICIYRTCTDSCLCSPPYLMISRMYIFENVHTWTGTGHLPCIFIGQKASLSQSPNSRGARGEGFLATVLFFKKAFTLCIVGLFFSLACSLGLGVVLVTHSQLIRVFHLISFEIYLCCREP